MITPAFLTFLIDAVAKAIPMDAEPDKEERADRLAFARTMFEAFQPTDALEAAQAARAVVAHLAAMDSFARAAKPGMSNDTVIRLRANAIAASRQFDTLLAARKQRKPAAALAEPQEAASGGTVTLLPERVYHRAELPPLIPGMAEILPPTARKDGLRSGTALGAIQPTVLNPG